MRLKPEEILQVECVEFTRIMCPAVIIVASMNGMSLGKGKNIGAYIDKMKRLGMRTGDLDLRLHWRLADGDGLTSSIARTGYIELKAGRNKPTDQQKLFMSDLDKIGIPNAWTNSVQGYVDILKEWVVPMRRGIYAGINI